MSKVVETVSLSFSFINNEFTRYINKVGNGNLVISQTTKKKEDYVANR